MSGLAVTAGAAVPALGRVWLNELMARCEREGLALPGGPQLHQKLSRPEVPPAARGRLAQVMHNEWVKGRQDVPPWQLQATVEAIEAWWHTLPEGTEPLGAGMVPAWIRVQGTLGHVQPLAEAALRWQAQLGQPEHEAVALALLRQLRRLKGEAAIEPTLALIDALGERWQPEVDWTTELTGSLAMVARAAEQLAPLQRVAAWVERLAPHTARPGVEAWRTPLVSAAVRCAHLPALRQLAEAMLAFDDPAANDGFALASAIATLADLAPGPEVDQLAERAAQAWPRQPSIQRELARRRRAAGTLVQDLAPPLLALEPTHPATPSAWHLLAEYAFHDGDTSLAEQVYQKLADIGAIDEQAQMRQAHLRLQHERVAALAQPGAARLHEAAGPTHFDTEALGPLAPALAALARLVAEPPRHDSPHTPADITHAGNEALAEFEAACREALAAGEGPTTAQALAAATQLWVQANCGALDLAHWDQVFPFDVGPAFGVLDGKRARAQCLAVLAHLVSLVTHVMHQDRPLRGAPNEGSAAALIGLLQLQLDARLAMRQPHEAQADLADARARLGALGAGAVEPMQERALLAAGQATTVQADIARLHPTEAAAARALEVWPLREWDDWLRAEGVSDHALVSDPPCPGQFEVVDVTGRLRVEHHAAVATTLSLARVTDLRVRAIHLLIAAQGGVLKPHPWHLQMADFPYPHPSVVARGAGGTVLRRAARWQRVDEPLVVLANMDAPFHRNYYHWMVLTLARIHGLMVRGILKTRRLLLPRELTGWMRSSLADIGLDESRIRWYEVADDLRLSDALVASPAEFASPTLVEGLRRCLWQAAGLDPDAPPPLTRRVYLARRGETRRPMAEAEEMIALAESLGFEIVAPETLSLLDQVRLFATARAIAGPPGAAFTNLMWTQPDCRVLTVYKQDIYSPTFLDLSFLRGQTHRWLQGRSLAGFEGVSIVTSPFSVDLALARQALQWAAGDA